MGASYQFRENGNHYNGGGKFFGYGYDAIGEPRLSMIRRWYRQGEKRGTCEDQYLVDGALMETWDAAAKALSVPPVFSAEEVAALQLIGDEPGDVRDLIHSAIRHTLRGKGAIVWGPPGQCKRTDLGREVAKGAKP